MIDELIEVEDTKGNKRVSVFRGDSFRVLT